MTDESNELKVRLVAEGGVALYKRADGGASQSGGGGVRPGHGQPEQYWIRELAPGALTALPAAFGSRPLTGRVGPDFTALNVGGEGGLAGSLAKVADHRKPGAVRRRPRRAARRGGCGTSPSTARPSRAKDDGRKAPHLLSACDVTAGAMLGQDAVDGKTNEISCLVPLLEAILANPRARRRPRDRARPTRDPPHSR